MPRARSVSIFTDLPLSREQRTGNREQKRSIYFLSPVPCSLFPDLRRMQMVLERWFRLSCYLTLGLSCVALVFAESFFLPGLPMCLAPILALLVLSWWVEGRWSLPARGANLLG